MNRKRMIAFVASVVGFVGSIASIISLYQPGNPDKASGNTHGVDIGGSSTGSVFNVSGGNVTVQPTVQPRENMKTPREATQVSTKSYVNHGLKHAQRIDLHLFDDNSITGTYLISVGYSDQEEDKLVHGFKGHIKDNQLTVDFIDQRLPYQTDPDDENSDIGKATWRMKRYAGGKESIAIQTYGRDYSREEITWREYVMEFEQVNPTQNPRHIY
ncbi:MAG: hypothetical protein ACFCA4_05790 [Cyanophyceae cyanobacterium]